MSIIGSKCYRICVKCGEEFDLSPKSRSFKCPKCRIKNKEVVIFGKKKHFGYYGCAPDGHKWWSLNEQDIEEWLIHKNIAHVPQKRLGQTLRHADQYLPEYDLYIEIDGLSRQDDVDWNGKLSLYDKLGLKYKIVKPVEHHFCRNNDKCFEELNKEFEFLKQ